MDTPVTSAEEPDHHSSQANSGDAQSFCSAADAAENMSKDVALQTERAKKQAIHNTQHTFSEGKIETLYQGNQQVNVYQMFGQKSSAEEAINPARELTFPQPSSQYEFEEQSMLPARQQFFEAHRWMIIASHADNHHLLSEAIATLVEEYEDHDYLIQQPNIRCEDYVHLPKMFACAKSSVTKFPIDDLDQFKLFLETRENLHKLSESLNEGQNRLLLVLNVDLDPKCAEQIKMLVKGVNYESQVAYWSPTLQLSDIPKDTEYAELDWLGKAMVTLGTWFASLPFNVYHCVILKMLRAKQTQYERIAKPGSDEEIKEKALSDPFPEWLINWQNDPDQYLGQYGLKNRVDAENGITGVGLSDPALRSAYRQAQLNLSPGLLQEMVDPLTESVLELIPSELGKPPSPQIRELAQFYRQLHRNMLLNLGIPLLDKMFAHYRYTNSLTQQTIYCFVDLLSALHKHPESTAVVEQYVENLVAQWQREERALQKKKSFEFKIDESIPPHEVRQRVDVEVRRHMELEELLFKDRVYATFNVIAWSVGIGESSSIRFLEEILMHSANVSQTGIYNLPSLKSLQYLMTGRLRLSSKDFQGVLENVSQDSSQDKEKYPLLGALLREFSFKLLKRTDKAIFDRDSDDIQYVFGLLFDQQAVERLIDLLLRDDERALVYSKQLLDGFISLTFNNAKKLEESSSSGKYKVMEFQADTNRRLKACLSYLAGSVDKTLYASTKLYLKTLLSQAREFSRNRKNPKDQRELAVHYKAAITLVKTHFNRNKKEQTK